MIKEINNNVYYEFMEEGYIYHMCWTKEELVELMQRKFPNYDFINCDYHFIKVVRQKRNYKKYYYDSLEDLLKDKYSYIERY